LRTHSVWRVTSRRTLILTTVSQDRTQLESYENDLRRLLHDAWGRRLAYRLLEDAGVWSVSFTGNSQTFFNEGRRDFGMQLYRDLLAADRDNFHTMMRENEA